MGLRRRRQCAQFAARRFQCLRLFRCVCVYVCVMGSKKREMLLLQKVHCNIQSPRPSSTVGSALLSRVCDWVCTKCGHSALTANCAVTKICIFKLYSILNFINLPLKEIDLLMHFLIIEHNNYKYSIIFNFVLQIVIHFFKLLISRLNIVFK